MSHQLPIAIPASSTETAGREKGTIRLLLTVMRPHQWTKNLFVLAPVLFGRKLTDAGSVIDALLAFVVFCLLASSVYIFNDWIDSDDDRAHPEKRKRPISSGELQAPIAITAAVLLLIAALGLSVFIGPTFVIVASVYVGLMACYCLSLKRMIVLDAMTIAVGFVLRVVGGAVAVNVETTHWLIACTFLLALFLAFTKRRQELLALSIEASNHRHVLSHYSVAYLENVNNILIGAAIVCYALYTVAPETVARFGTDNLIYGSVFVIYGMLRYLALVNDPQKGGNPSKLLLSDVPLLIAVWGWAVFNAAMIYRSNLQELWFRLQILP